MLTVSRLFLDRHRCLRHCWWVAAFLTLQTIHLGALLVTVNSVLPTQTNTVHRFVNGDFIATGFNEQTWPKPTT